MVNLKQNNEYGTLYVTDSVLLTNLYYKIPR